jgi:hypothetical protein
MVRQNMTAPPQQLSTDTAFELLAHEQRRRALRHVVDEDGHTTVDQLVDALLTDTSPSVDPETAREQLEIRLHHLIQRGSPAVHGGGNRVSSEKQSIFNNPATPNFI